MQQQFNYQIGLWKARANVCAVDDGKLLATIRVSENEDEDSIVSQHTVVFEHNEGKDAAEETKLIMHDLLSAHYEP
jgi:hypothetical protein